MHLTDTGAVSTALENYRHVDLLSIGQGEAAERECGERFRRGTGCRLGWDKEEECAVPTGTCSEAGSVSESRFAKLERR